jgi:hypothetical protein
MPTYQGLGEKVQAEIVLKGKSRLKSKKKKKKE